MQHPRWKITARQRESESHWLSLQRSVKDVPLWINRLVIGPMVGQTAALRLANRLASPLYYCVVTDTHTHARATHAHTLSLHADLHTWARVNGTNRVEADSTSRKEEIAAAFFLFVFFSFFCARREKYFRGTNWEKSVRKGGKIEMETEE